MDENDENTMKILVATDIHLGYNENHPIRGEDSFISFEEILKHARDLNVDFILLGGDLFHDTRPTTYCLDKCISLLRRYCLGDKEIEIEFLSDQSLNFKHCRNPQVNYEDPNYNIAIPVFSIHGNHDDPTGANKLSALDLLSDIGLVNYFGKWTDLTHVNVDPLVIAKGETKLALFGLSHIRDERLSRLFKQEDVDIMKIQEDNIFNLLVLHQNRANRGTKNFIPEEVIPEFIDLVIWGHEHDCRITPESAPNGVQISQPGSSVATSLAEGESLQKHVGLLLINKSSFEMKKIVLKTVRPFVFKSYEHNPKDENMSNAAEKTKKLVMKIVESMIEEAKTQIHEDEPKQPELPLIRLVFTVHSEKQQFNAIRIGQQFTGRVANPEDMILLKRKTQRSKGRSNYDKELDDVHENLVSEGTFSEQMERLLETYMLDHENPLQILSSKGLCEATTRFLDNNDDNAFNDLLDYYSEKCQKLLLEQEFDEGAIHHRIKELAEQNNEEGDKIQQMFDDPSRQKKTYDAEGVDNAIQVDSDNDDMNDSTNDPGTSKATRGNTTTRRPSRGRGSRGPRGSRGRAKAAAW